MGRVPAQGNQGSGVLWSSQFSVIRASVLSSARWAPSTVLAMSPLPLRAGGDVRIMSLVSGPRKTRTTRHLKRLSLCQDPNRPGQLSPHFLSAPPNRVGPSLPSRRGRRWAAVSLPFVFFVFLLLVFFVFLFLFLFFFLAFLMALCTVRKRT